MTGAGPAVSEYALPMSEASPDRGFIRVDCPACRNPDVWFTCNACKKSDHFAMHADHVACDCGQRYDHGTCTCGATVPFDGLRFVAWDQGPMSLADLEVAWGRVAGLAVVAVLVLAGITWAMLT